MLELIRRSFALCFKKASLLKNFCDRHIASALCKRRVSLMWSCLAWDVQVNDENEIGSIDRSIDRSIFSSEDVACLGNVIAVYRFCTVAYAYCSGEDDGIGHNLISRSIWDTESPSGRPSLPVNKAIRWPKLVPSSGEEWLSGRYFAPWENIELSAAMALGTSA